MNDADNFALVPRAPDALEKAEPGAKGILSGTDADTPALVKKEPDGKAILTILVGGDADTIKNFQAVIGLILKDEYDVRFVAFGTESELIKAVEEQPFDLIIIYLWGVFWNTWGDGFVARAVEVLARLKAQYRKPILAQQITDLTEQFKGTGVTFCCCLDFQTLWKFVGLCAKAPASLAENLGEAPQAAQPRTGKS